MKFAKIKFCTDLIDLQLHTRFHFHVQFRFFHVCPLIVTEAVPMDIIGIASFLYCRSLTYAGALPYAGMDPNLHTDLLP